MNGKRLKWLRQVWRLACQNHPLLFTDTPQGDLLRTRLWKNIKAVYKPGMKPLEIVEAALER